MMQYKYKWRKVSDSMSDNAFGKCIDTLASVIFDLYVKEKIDFSEFSLFGSYEPLDSEDDYYDLINDFIASFITK